MIIEGSVIVLCVTTSHSWPIHSCALCFYTNTCELTSPAEGTCRPQGLSGWWRWRCEIGSGQVSLCTPAAGLISCSLALFTRAPELNVNQEHRKGRHSGAEAPTMKARLNLPFERTKGNGEEGDSKRERVGWVGASWESETFTVMVIGRSVLERQAAVLSKSSGRRPVALQRAAQQCLSQHINNSSVLACVCILKRVRTVKVRVRVSCLI